MTVKIQDLRGSLPDESVYYTQDHCVLVFNGSIDNLLTLPDVFTQLESYDHFYELMEVCSEFILKYIYQDNNRTFTFLPEAHDILPTIMQNYNIDDYSLSRLIVGACFHSFISIQRSPINQKPEFYDMVDDLESLPMALKIIVVQRAELGMIISKYEERIFSISRDSILDTCKSQHSTEQFTNIVKIIDRFSSLLKLTSN